MALRLAGVIACVLTGLAVWMTAAPPVRGQASARPNILWISNEDMSPRLGVYGDALARTPVLDRFAAQAVRYTRAFTTAPVCAPSRAAIITGLAQNAIGAQHMRTTENRVPELPGPYLAVPPFYVKAFPEYLRAAGYFTSNRSKTDYQFGEPFTIWDQVGGQAHWRNRRDPTQPFFSATNRAPERAIRDGTLRQDLYYRLNVVSLAVPPLRDRSGDVPALARELLDAIRPRVHRPDVRGLSKAALSALESYAWPGNVRELINVLERAALLCDGPEITPADLPAAVTSGAPAGAAGSEWDDLLDLTMGEARDELVERFEREYLERLLREANGGIGEAARRAGIDERTLYNKMRRYGLRKESFRSG
jgi:hypothetical protein